MHQLLEEQDHQLCAQGNKKALLAEKLDALQALVKVVQQEDWMFLSAGDPVSQSSGARSHNSLSPSTFISDDPTTLF